MAYSIPATEPEYLRANTTWAWRRDDLGDFPPSVWTLIYHFRNAAGYFDVTAVEDDGGFLVSVPPATTAAIAAGRYTWFAQVTDGSDTHEIDGGFSEVLADVSAAVAHDGRSWERRMLDAVEAALENRATTDQLDLIAGQVGDRSKTRDRSVLRELHAQLRIEVARIEKKNGSTRLVVRFGAT